MNSMRVSFVFFLLGCGSVACAPALSPPPSTPDDVATAGDQKEEEEPVTPELEARAAKIRVLESNEGMGCPMEMIGLVDVHEPVKTVDQALRELRLDAARLDAEAVVGVEFHHGEPGEEPTHLSGEAVRCNDLLQGRSYDVIDEIKVATKMGTEEALYSELRRKAKSEGADLILNVQFVHGEGGDEPIRMSGTAVRFKDQ